jgi:hypothetical protein
LPRSIGRENRQHDRGIVGDCQEKDQLLSLSTSLSPGKPEMA